MRAGLAEALLRYRTIGGSPRTLRDPVGGVCRNFCRFGRCCGAVSSTPASVRGGKDQGAGAAKADGLDPPTVTHVTRMYRTLLTALFAGILALALVAGTVAWWGSQESRWQLERTRLATEVTQHYLRLRAEIYHVFTRMADAVENPGRVKEVREALERARMLETLDSVRRAIGQEVAFVGVAEDETEELAQLAEIERGVLHVFSQFRDAKALIAAGRESEAEVMLDRALREAIISGFRDTVDAAVREEEEEAAVAHARARVVLDWVSWVSKLSAVLVLIVGLGGLAALLRRLRLPLQELESAARAVQAGDLERRARVGGSGEEFTRVADSFNAMVQQVAASRAMLEAEQRQLEAAVADRTAELAAANAALQRADASRRRFLADISHELRTPITVIRGEAEITLRGEERPAADYRTALLRIAEQAAHTGRLVDDLLFLARAGDGAPRIQLRAVALGALLGQVVSETAAAAEMAGVSLRLSDAAPDTAVEGDAGRLRQVMMILLDNAIRYSEPGEVVEVSLCPAPGGVALRVADQGIGIDPEDLPHVFERFYRGGRAQARQEEGSGLGLPLAKAIVEAHGGRIALDSDPGRGTVASVILPAAQRLRAVA